MILRSAIAVCGLTILGMLTASIAIAKNIVGTETPRRESMRIAAVGADEPIAVVTLPLSAATRAPGEYAIWYDHGRGYARVGEVVAVDECASVVTREVISSLGSTLRAGQTARWSGVVPSRPEDLELPFTTVNIPTALGSAPATRFDATPHQSKPSTWAIHIHGQGATRAGPLRGIPVAHSAGLTSLVVSYRNDQEAPNSDDRRSMLGQTEWLDVEAALDYAREQGAQGFVLVGWSMGASIALLLARSSKHRDLILGLCLVAPVTDWRSTIIAGGRSARLPPVLIRLAMHVLADSSLRRTIQLQETIDLHALDWIRNGSDLRIPTLVLHSAGDKSVPIELSRAFSEAHKDTVELVELPATPHTLEWNRDRELWESALAEWLSRRTD